MPSIVIFCLQKEEKILQNIFLTAFWMRNRKLQQYNQIPRMLGRWHFICLEKKKKELRRPFTGVKHKNHRKNLHINKTKLHILTGQNAAERVKYKDAILSEGKDMGFFHIKTNSQHKVHLWFTFNRNMRAEFKLRDLTCSFLL